MLIAAADGLAAGIDIGAGNAFQGDDQHIARLAGLGEQGRALQIEPGEVVDVRRAAWQVRIEPVLGLPLRAAQTFGQQFMRQVELQPLVGVAGAAVLQGGMADKQHQPGKQPDGGERRLRGGLAPA